MKTLRKLLKLRTVLICGLLCAFLTLTCSAGENTGNGADQEAVIGISVYDISDSEVQAFREYFEQYIGASFNVEFIYSENIATAEEEREFIQKLHERGVGGIISFVSSFAETSVPLCDSLGMYYISGSGTLNEEIFEKLKDYPTFLGTIGPSPEEEHKAGAWIADHFCRDDAEGSRSYLVYTGGSSFGNEMHRVRAIGVLETLDEAYGLVSDQSAEELAESEEITSLDTEKGVKILLYPGYSAELEISVETLSPGEYDTVLSVAMFKNLVDVVQKAEKASGINIQVGVVGCFTEEANTYFNTKDSSGDSLINCLVGKYGAIVAPAYTAMMNAYTGYAEEFREGGEAFCLYQPFWYADSTEEFNDQYVYSIGIADNTYTAVEIMKNLKEYNPNADFEQFSQFTER